MAERHACPCVIAWPVDAPCNSESVSEDPGFESSDMSESDMSVDMSDSDMSDEHSPCACEQSHERTVQTQITKNARTLLSSVAASHRRTVTSVLTESLKSKDAQTHLDINPRYFRHAREKGFDPFAQRLFSEK